MQADIDEKDLLIVEQDSIIDEVDFHFLSFLSPHEEVCQRVSFNVSM